MKWYPFSLRLPGRALAAGVLLAVSAAVLAGCGGGDEASGADRPTVIATTSVLGDLVANVAGDLVAVEVVIPAGADPHEFQPSARQVARLREADALVVNGGGFEEGLEQVLRDAADDGVPTFVALDALAGDEHDHDAAHDHDHDAGHDDHGHDGHDHGPVDPHFFSDPVRTADVVRALGGFLAEEVDVDAAAITEAAGDFAGMLAGPLHEEVAALVAQIPEDRRVLVTNHAVLGYFAERYGFDVVGTVLPGRSTADAGSAGEVARLASELRELGVPAVFVDASAPADLARTLAGEVGDVAVVELFTESLGGEGSGADTYVGMVRTNAARIVDALAPAGS